MSRSLPLPLLVALVAIPLPADATPGTANRFYKSTGLANSGNYDGGAPGATQDISFTTSATNLTLTSTNLFFGSLNVTNGTAYTVTNSSSTKDSTLTLGGGGRTNGTFGAGANDLIYLSNRSSLTLQGPGSTNGYSFFTLSLTLAAAGNFNVAAGSTLTLSTAISGANALGITGAGTVTLAGVYDNALSGPVTVAAGTLNLAKTSGATALAGDLMVTGGTVNFQQSNQLATSRTLTLNGGTVDLGTKSNTVTKLVLAGGTLAGTTGVLTGATNAFDVRAGSIGAVLGGSVGLVKTTDGTVTLTGANAYSGGTTVGAGVLALAGGDNRLKSTGAISVTGGTLDLGTTNQSAGTVSLTAGRIAGTGTLNGTSYSITGGSLDARLAGSGAMTIGGVAVLSGDNSGWSGLTTINRGGRLTPGHNAALGSGSVTLSNGGMLDLNGRSLGNAITVASGGIFTGAGTLTGPLTLQAGAIYAFTLGGGITLGAGGAATLREGALLSLASLTPASFTTSVDRIWTVISHGSGSITGTALKLTEVDAGVSSLGTFSTSLANGDVVLKWTSNVSAVPEPMTFGVLAGVGALAGAVWRKRKRLWSQSPRGGKNSGGR